MTSETGEELTLEYVAVKTADQLGEVLKRKCGSSKDFWFGFLARADHEELARKLPGLQVGPFWAAEAFTHCFASLSEDAETDFARLTEKFGLGQRSRRPNRRCPGQGIVFLLLNTRGFSKLYKRNIELAAAPKTKQTERKPGKRARDKEKDKEKRAKSRLGTRTIDAEQILQDAEASRDSKRVSASVVIDPLGDDCAGSKAEAQPLPSQAGLRPPDQRQVAVITKRLQELLPQLPVEQLSTALALTKLEESFRKKKGRFDAFRPDIERIIISYMAIHPSRAQRWKPSAPESKVPSSPTKAKLPASPAKAQSRRASSEPGEEVELISVHLAPSQETQERPQDVQATEALSLEMPEAESVDQVELSDEERDGSDGSDGSDAMVEVDIDGFQIALAQLRDASDPRDALAVLGALRSSQPTTELLEWGAWEAALGAHERMACSRRVTRLARKIREEWQQRISRLHGERMFQTALTALEQLTRANESCCAAPDEHSSH